MSLLMMALALAGTAPAEDRHVGAWTIGPATSDSCQATAQFGDDIAVSIEEDSGGTGHFVIADHRWLLSEGDVKAGIFSWQDETWRPSVNADFTVHRTPSGAYLLVAETGSWMTENMVGKKGFWLKIPGVDFDDNFEIPEASEITSALAACNSEL